MLFKESVDTKNQYLDMVSLHEEDNNQKIKERQGTEGTHLSEPQKAHVTREFIIVV